MIKTAITETGIPGYYDREAHEYYPGTGRVSTYWKADDLEEARTAASLTGRTVLFDGGDREIYVSPCGCEVERWTMADGSLSWDDHRRYCDRH